MCNDLPTNSRRRRPKTADPGTVLTGSRGRSRPQNTRPRKHANMTQTANLLKAAPAETGALGHPSAVMMAAMPSRQSATSTRTLKNTITVDDLFIAELRDRRLSRGRWCAPASTSRERNESGRVFACVGCSGSVGAWSRVCVFRVGRPRPNPTQSGRTTPIARKGRAT